MFFNKNKSIKMGNLVKDSITGLEGIVVAISKSAHNCDRVGIQVREVKEGKIPDAVWFDLPQTLFIKNTKVPIIDCGKPKFSNGDEVEDMISGYTGTVTGNIFFINGCIRTVFQCKGLTRDGLPIDDIYKPESQIRLIKSANVTYEQESSRVERLNEPLPPKAVVKPGGPMDTKINFRSFQL